MTRDEMLALLGRLGACKTARYWAGETPGTPEEVFEKCDEPDWLGWLVDALLTEGVLSPDTVRKRMDELVDEGMVGSDDPDLRLAYAAYKGSPEPADETVRAALARAGGNHGGGSPEYLRAILLRNAYYARGDSGDTLSLGERFQYAHYRAACLRAYREYINDPDEARLLRDEIRSWVFGGLAALVRKRREQHEENNG